MNLKINSANKTYCAPDWCWDTEGQLFCDFNLWTVIGGRGLLKTPKENYRLIPGSCFLLRGGERYIGSTDEDDPLVVIHIHFDYICKGRVVIPTDDGIPHIYRRINILSFFQTILERILTAYRNKNSDDACQWLKTALLEMGNNYNTEKYFGIELEQSQKIDTICSEIIKNPGKIFIMKDLAGYLNCSTDHFSRLFKKHMCVSPSGFIIRTRMETATSLLLSSSHSIKRISELLGYSDVYFFSKQFRIKMGVSPLKYRKKNHHKMQNDLN